MPMLPVEKMRLISLALLVSQYFRNFVGKEICCCDNVRSYTPSNNYQFKPLRSAFSFARFDNASSASTVVGLSDDANDGKRKGVMQAVVWQMGIISCARLDTTKTGRNLYDNSARISRENKEPDPHESLSFETMLQI